MNLSLFIAKRLAAKREKSFSASIIRLAIAGVAISIAVMIIAVAVVTGFQQEIRDKVIGFGGHAVVKAIETGNALESKPISREEINKVHLENLPGVVHTQFFAHKAGIIKTTDNIEGIFLKGVDSTFDWDFFRSNLVEGKTFKVQGPNTVDQVLVSRYTANKLNLKLGDKIPIYFIQQPVRVRRLEICGIYETGLEELDQVMALTDIKHIQQLNGWTADQVSGAEILLNSFEHLDMVKEEINRQLPIELECVTIRDRQSNIFDWLDLLDTNVVIILVLMGIVAGINMVTALFILIIERTRMIGVLKALGAANRQINGIFHYQALYLLGWGLFIGNVIGLGCCLVQKYTHWLRLDKASYYMTFVPVNLDILPIVLVNAGTLLLCLLAVLIPVRQVNRVQVVKAIRFN